jgi:hypothetical protein
LVAILVANGAQLACTMGTVPSPLTVVPEPTHDVTVAPPPAQLATINDFVPLTNIKSFGMCKSLLNPAVQAATTAAFGVFTPAPCVPATAAPWAPPQRVLLTGVPAFDQAATCQCAWQGTVKVVTPGQTGVVTGA